MDNSKNKIGIIAPFDEPNYGTVLQAFALQKKLSDYGFYTEYIRFNYSTASLWKFLISNVISLLKRFLHKQKLMRTSIDDYSFFHQKEFKPIIEGYKAFVNKYTRFSRRTYTPHSLHHTTEYGCFIVGSDQTWSEARCNSKHPYYLADVPIKSKKYAYAPSIGTTEISPRYLIKLMDGIKDFDMLSCREKSNCDVLSKKLGRKVYHVVDPTLLLSPKDWNEIAASHNLPPRGYVLCYILGEKDIIAEFAEKLGKSKELPVYYIVTRPKYLKKQNTLYPTPEFFISLIRDAAFVVTDSFHGTIFSINYGVSFYSFSKREGNVRCIDNARICEFLGLLDLENRFVDESSIMKISFSPIDYVLVQSKLNKLRENSICYISKLVGNYQH